MNHLTLWSPGPVRMAARPLITPISPIYWPNFLPCVTVQRLLRKARSCKLKTVLKKIYLIFNWQLTLSGASVEFVINKSLFSSALTSIIPPRLFWYTYRFCICACSSFSSFVSTKSWASSSSFGGMAVSSSFRSQDIGSRHTGQRALKKLVLVNDFSLRTSSKMKEWKITLIVLI